jgi:hypothetical protein
MFIQGDSYSFINILTSGRFPSQKALDNKILSHILNTTIEANNCCYRETIGIIKFLKGGSTLFNMLYLQQF